MKAESNEARSPEFGKSIKGLNWKLDESCERTVLHLCQRLGVDEILARILCNRDIKTVEEAENFLDPKIKNLIQNPFTLMDMDKAVERIIQALIKKEKIYIYGDYDVDGATSSALMRLFFKSLNHTVSVYIPNRITEGYGPNIEAFKRIKSEDCDLIITVDCGIVSFDPIQYANQVGMDVVIIDHHLSLDHLPKAVAIVNPNRFDETFKYKSMAAVGVAFMTVVAIRKRLRELDWFKQNNVEEPLLLNLLDLVALGTVCDVVSLKGINRAFVAQGLKILAQRSNVGLATLANVSKLTSAPKAHHLGFVFGPKINAGGRVGEGMLGTNLLYTDSPQEAYEICLKLNYFNEERKILEGKALDEALMQVIDNKLYENSAILVQSSNWHVGILGILASRLKEKYSKPVGVMMLKDGIAKGSFRSINGLDIGSTIANAKLEGLLLEGGGHHMAGGFALKVENIPSFYEFINARFKSSNEPYLKAKELLIDAVVSIEAINHKLLENINIAAPYGNDNPFPRFVLDNVKILNSLITGVDHIMLVVGDPISNSSTQKCILFKGAETNMGQFLLKNRGAIISVAGTLQINNFDNNKIDFIIDDVAH